MAQNKSLSIWEKEQKHVLESALLNHKWKIRPAAEALGLYRTRVYRLMKRFGLKRPKTR